MIEVPGRPPSPSRLVRRLALLTAGGLESGGRGQSPLTDMRGRLAASRRLLLHLAAMTRDVDETVIDRMIRDAEEAIRKLDGEGADAVLSGHEAYGLEAVIETDGSRPVVFVRDGKVDPAAPELQESFAARWQAAASFFAPQIRNVLAAVGAVQLPAMDRLRVGTAFAIAPGLVLTNRHVLEEIAVLEDGVWKWRFEVEIDFVGENDRPGTNRFPLTEVVLAGPHPINHQVDFTKLDIAVLRAGGDLGRFPRPLSMERSPDRVRVGDGRRPSVYVVGFPAKPLVAAAAAGPPGAGQEYQDVLDKLFQDRFGSKRWAPGLVEAGAGQLANDPRKWVMSHDASTLGGNSGSCVVDFSDNGERVVGLHFGGQTRVANYAHVVAALQDDMAALDKIAWI